MLLKHPLLARRARKHLLLPQHLTVLLCGSGATAKIPLLPVTLLLVALVAAVEVSVAAATVMADKTSADLATGAVITGTTAAVEIVATRVEGEAARTSGTFSLRKPVLLVPLPLPLRNRIHVTITLDNRLRLDCKNSSRCLCMVGGRNGCRRLRSSSNRANSSSSHRRTVHRMHRPMMNMEAAKVPCQSSRVMHPSLQAQISLGRRMALAIAS